MFEGNERWGAIMLPCFGYLIYQRWFLNVNELVILLVNCVMLLGLLLGGWIAMLAYLIGYGYHNFVVL